MARKQQDLGTHHSDPPPAVAGRLAIRAGIALCVLALPLAVGTFLVLVLSAPSLGAGLDSAAAAVEGPLGTPGGVAWLLHLGVIGLLVGAWLVGAGLLVTELLD